MGGVGKTIGGVFSGVNGVQTRRFRLRDVKTLLDGPPKPTKPEAPLEGETPAQAAARRRKALAAQARLSGRASTISTSPLGLTDRAPTEPRRLLGGL